MGSRRLDLAAAAVPVVLGLAGLACLLVAYGVMAAVWSLVQEMIAIFAAIAVWTSGGAL